MIEIAKDYLNKFAPGSSIKIKEDSKLMKIISYLVYFFNPKFLDQYITTIGNTIYFPKRLLENKNPFRFLEIVVHESFHINQYKQYSILFMLGYLFPQSLILFLLPLLLLLGCGWFTLLSLLVLLPFPAYFRFKWELEAYRTSILFGRKIFKFDERTMDLIKAQIVSQLSGKFYYFCWPFKKHIYKLLNDERAVLENPKYLSIYEHFKQTKVVP